MQKITVTFIYGKDDTRKLKYRLTGDVPIGVMLEKLIGFQFIVDSADPKTFNVLHKGIQIEDLSKTFEECEVIDGDEIYLVPTVFDPIPPLPENDVPIKKAPSRSHDKDNLSGDEHHHSHHRQNQSRQGGTRNNGNSSYGNSRRGNHQPQQQRKQGASQGERKPQSQKPAPSSPQNEKKEGPIPFKPHSRNYHRNHGRKPGNTPNKQS
ncbi:MAG: hypothetical protein Q4G23_08335 [Clostridia bacterium]|nr:hypothetical protein [Clostridia bacterium]